RKATDPITKYSKSFLFRVLRFAADQTSFVRNASARLSAFQAARHRVWRTRFSKTAGILTVSPACRDIDKFGGAQSTRRTAAMASLNVGSCLRYHAAAFGRSAEAVSRTKLSAHTVISENNPSKAGVVRRIARSDHWRCVSTPRCARTS